MAEWPSWHLLLILLLSLVYFASAQRLSGPLLIKKKKIRLTNRYAGVSAGLNAADAAAFASWRGRNVDYAILYHPGDSWNSIIVLYHCLDSYDSLEVRLLNNRSSMEILHRS